MMAKRRSTIHGPRSAKRRAARRRFVSIPEAARLTRKPERSIRRWATKGFLVLGNEFTYQCWRKVLIRPHGRGWRLAFKAELA